MRKIEQQMIEAVEGNEFWMNGATKVCPGMVATEVWLHGSMIAYVIKGTVTPNLHTLRKYPTNTTMSRLRALGVNVYRRNGATFIDDKTIYQLMNPEG